MVPGSQPKTTLNISPPRAGCVKPNGLLRRPLREKLRGGKSNIPAFETPLSGCFIKQVRALNRCRIFSKITFCGPLTAARRWSFTRDHSHNSKQDNDSSPAGGNPHGCNCEDRHYDEMHDFYLSFLAATNHFAVRVRPIINKHYNNKQVKYCINAPI